MKCFLIGKREWGGGGIATEMSLERLSFSGLLMKAKPGEVVAMDDWTMEVSLGVSVTDVALKMSILLPYLCCP